MTAAPGQVSPTEKDKFVRQLVSVIMPAYNAGKYIAQSIRSVAAQTCAGWELVVVDDGSTDDTAEVVRGFASADARVKYVQQANGRQGRARNNGIAHAAGDLIAFLDADDLWVERKLELQLKAFAVEEKAVAVDEVGVRLGEGFQCCCAVVFWSGRARSRRRPPTRTARTTSCGCGWRRAGRSSMVWKRS
jgi:glycosyltransferase involved in cell wall biosynthesis